jgi:hypothetical protein
MGCVLSNGQVPVEKRWLVGDRRSGGWVLGVRSALKGREHPPNVRVEPPRAGDRSAPQAQTLPTRLRRASDEATRAARTPC